MSLGVRAQRQRLLLGAAVCLVVAGAAWMLHRPALEAIGNYLDTGQAPQHADAVLVLAGGISGERILKAGELVRQGFAPVAYVSGPRTFFGMSECTGAIPYAERHGYPGAAFRCIESDALSTRAEAQACCDAMRQADVRRFLLVTSAYHARRAGQMYRKYCPQLEFTTVSAESPLFLNREWYKAREGRKAILAEYVKLLTTPFGL